MESPLAMPRLREWSVMQMSLHAARPGCLGHFEDGQTAV